MERVLDGAMPMVIGLCLYILVIDKPVTIPVIIVMGLATLSYHAIKLRNSKSRQENS